MMLLLLLLLLLHCLCMQGQEELKFAIEIYEGIVRHGLVFDAVALADLDEVSAPQCPWMPCAQF